MEHVEERYTPHNSQPCIKFICFMQNALLGAETGVVDSKGHISTNVILLDSAAVYKHRIAFAIFEFELVFQFPNFCFYLPIAEDQLPTAMVQVLSGVRRRQPCERASAAARREVLWRAGAKTAPLRAA